MLKFVGVFLILAGLMAIAGSAGDCDGKCMEYANSFGEIIKAECVESPLITFRLIASILMALKKASLTRISLKGFLTFILE